MAEQQYLIFNLLAGGKLAWDNGDYATAASKWEALLRGPTRWIPRWRRPFTRWLTRRAPAPVRPPAAAAPAEAAPAVPPAAPERDRGPGTAAGAAVNGTVPAAARWGRVGRSSG